MINEQQAGAISLLTGTVVRLEGVAGAEQAVKNLVAHIEEMTAFKTGPLTAGEYPIDGSGWVLKVVDGAFALHDDEGVIRLKAQANPEPETPQAEPTFEETLEKLDTRGRFGLLSTLMVTEPKDPAERDRQVKLVADKLGMTVIRL